MREILEKIIVAICLVLIGILIVSIGATTNIPGFHVLMDGFWQFVGQLWSDIQLVCGTVLLLGVIGVLLYFKREYKIIRPGKYGEAQALMRGKEVIALPRASIVESQDTAEHIKQLEQYLNFTKKMIATAKSFDAYYGGGEDEEEEDVIDEEPSQIDRPRSEYLHISDDYQPHADEFLSGRKLIIGISGSGKSNTTATTCEELGRLDVPMILADTENEYESLCDRRWLPHGILADRTMVTHDNAADFGKYVLEQNLQVILNLASYDSLKEGALVMISIIAGLRNWQESRSSERRVPVEFLLEEATTWLPQNVKESPLYGTEEMNRLQDAFFNDLVRKGRKRGLGLTVICQKIAEIDKRALQCNVKLLHRQTELNDLEKYAKMGITNEETLSLADGEGFFFSSKVSKMLIQVRRRYSEHGANTPGLSELRQYQQSRNSLEKQQANGEMWRNGFERLAEPFENISKISELPRKPVGKGVPETTQTAILDLYRGGHKRTDIQEMLDLNGDEYWMVKAVCDAYDRSPQGGR
jgi:hypothetical protein